MRKMNELMKFGTVPRVEGISSRPSPFLLGETLERLTNTIKSHNLTIFASFDHSNEARQVGLEMQEAHVLIFGNPKAGTPLMIANPLLALDLPLKVLVWQGHDKMIWVSFTDVLYLKTRYSIPKELVANISGVEGLIELALQG